MAISKVGINYDEDRFLAALRPGIHSHVGNALKGIVDKAMEDVRKSLEEEFCKGVEITLDSALKTWDDTVEFKVTVDLRKDK